MADASPRERLESYAKSFLLGVLLFIALALLLHPELGETAAGWATFYGDF